MQGFIIVVFKTSEEPNLTFNWKKKFDFQDDRVIHSYNTKSCIAEKNSSIKFASEIISFENDNFITIIEGLILNRYELTVKYKLNDFNDFFINIFNNKNCVGELKGNFCGVVFDKINKRCMAFNNHTATKKIFYYYSDKFVVISTDLFTLSDTLKQLKISRTPDIESAYFLLGSGFMHNNKTLINEVKQIRAGEILEFQEKIEINSSFYFHLDNIVENTDSKEQIIENLDNYFSKALDYGFNFDKVHHLNSLVTLSGGLDSRLVSLYAYKKGYKNQQIINFSEYGYADQQIALKIASDFKFKFNYYKLGANCLSYVDEAVKVNDGLTLYLGSALIFDVIPKIDIQNSGMLHTGVLGDAILGSYLKSIEPQKASLSDGNYSSFMPESAIDLINSSINKYSDEEKYKFYNRGFTGINNGILYYDLFTESYSPFLDSEFMSYALSIPRKFRYQEKVYIEWLLRKHPEICGYVWENIGGKPTNNKLIRNYYRYKRSIIKRLPIKSMWKNNMAPEQIWFEKSRKQNDFINNYFLEQIDMIDFDKKLKADLCKVFDQKGINEKSQVLTYLSAYKLLF